MPLFAASIQASRVSLLLTNVLQAVPAVVRGSHHRVCVSCACCTNVLEDNIQHVSIPSGSSHYTIKDPTFISMALLALVYSPTYQHVFRDLQVTNRGTRGAIYVIYEDSKLRPVSVRDGVSMLMPRQVQVIFLLADDVYNDECESVMALVSKYNPFYELCVVTARRNLVQTGFALFNSLLFGATRTSLCVDTCSACTDANTALPSAWFTDSKVDKLIGDHIEFKVDTHTTRVTSGVYCLSPKCGLPVQPHPVFCAKKHAHHAYCSTECRELDAALHAVTACRRMHGQASIDVVRKQGILLDEKLAKTAGKRTEIPVINGRRDAPTGPAPVESHTPPGGPAMLRIPGGVESCEGTVKELHDVLDQLHIMH
jgi:hypothetical protein